MVINTETYSRPKDEKLIRNSAPKWAICSTPPHPRAQGLLRKDAQGEQTAEEDDYKEREASQTNNGYDSTHKTCINQCQTTSRLGEGRKAGSPTPR